MSTTAPALQRDYDLQEAGASFLTLNPSARISALGGYQAAAKGGAADVVSNPAAMSALEIPELWVSHNQSFEGTRFESIGLGLPLKRHSLAVIAQYLDEGGDERVDLGANDTVVTGLGQFNWTTLLAQAAYSYRVADKLSLGLALKGWREDRALTTSNGFGSDAGALLSISRSFDFGMVYRNFGPSVDGYSLPKSFSVGGAYHLLPNKKLLRRISLFSELNTFAHKPDTVITGLEVHDHLVSLRAGYRHSSKQPSDPLDAFSFGIGTRIKGWKLDYAWEPRNQLGSQHRITAGIGLGLTNDEKMARANELDQAMEKRTRERSRRFLDEARVAYKQGDLSEAKQLSEKAILWDPANHEAREFSRIVDSKLQSAEVEELYRQGEENFRRNQPVEAAFLWKKTLQLAPNHPKAAQALKQAERQIRETAKESAMSEVEDQTNERAIKAYLDGDYDSAIQQWEALYQRNPRRPNILAYIEKAKNKKLETEVAALKRGVAVKQSEVDILTQQAYTLYTLGKTEDAIRTWEKAVALDPNNEDAVFALREAKKKKKLDLPSDPSSSSRVRDLNNQALIAYSKGELEKAISLWRQALLIEPQNRWIKNSISRVEAELAFSRGQE